ncbi:MAG TPA: amidohydrolase family protein, partial [Candidatus Acidoferrales bacterium]|nr:amidohydrolase family protein [Candidatus Acidoferrales bacterium]
TAIALALRELVHTNRIPLMRMVELFTAGPARVLGKQTKAGKLAEGCEADVTIFSLDREWTYRTEESPSRSRNTPFDGQKFKGGPVATIVGGKIAYRS